MIDTHIKTKIPGPISQNIIKQMNQVFPIAQYGGLYGIVLQSGEGSYLTDVDGNVYLDFLSGACAATLGYGREDIIDAYVQAARQIQHTCSVYSPNSEAVKLAQKLIEITPGGFPKQVLFGLSGSDSIDAAIKISRRATGNPSIISFRKSYHGSTGYSIGANGFGKLQEGLFLESGFQKVDFPRTAEEAECSLDAVNKLLKGGGIATVIVEPIQGDGGNVEPPDFFHHELIDLAHKFGAVFVVDEVQSGMGRSGSWWEIETFGVTPDILCTGKGLTGGFIPMSACIAREELAKNLGKAQHLFTYSGHPPSCAVALKVIDVIEKENIRQNAQDRGNQLKEGLRALPAFTRCNSQLRGRGLHLGLAVFEADTGQPLGGLFAFRCVEKGLYAGYFGEQNEVIRLHPPLSTSETEMQIAINTIQSVFLEWEGGRFPAETIERYRKNACGLGES